MGDAPTRSVRVLIAIAVLSAAGLATWLILRRHGGSNDELFTGYVVSDNLYLSSPVAGTLISVAVRRGQRVAAGDSLFRVDPTVRAAQAEQARELITINEKQMEQQQSGLEGARAELAAAQADAAFYGVQVERLTAARNEERGSVAQLDLEQAQASRDSATHRRDAAAVQVETALAAIAASSARVQQARSGLAAAQRELDELSPSAPSAGRIEEVMFKPGESVPANVPIVSIVPDGEVKVRFYVPQSLISSYKPGKTVAIAFDGGRSGITADVEFVASEPEYTPPVIYSLDARQKLMFLVEAIPSDPGALVPGQPIDVAPTTDHLPQR